MNLSTKNIPAYIKKEDVLKKSFEVPGYFCNLISSFDVASMSAKAVVPVPQSCIACVTFKDGSYFLDISIPLNKEQLRAILNEDVSVWEVLSWDEE